METSRKTSKDKSREEIARRRMWANYALALVILLALAIGLSRWWVGSRRIDADTVSDFEIAVTGAVENPGTYNMSEGDTIHELVVLAGGFHEGADRDAVTLVERLNVSARPVIDIPFRPDYSPSKTPKPGEYDYPININTADELELQVLKGIGPALAKRIVAYREEHGPFGIPAEIMNVYGIGLEKYKDIHGLITVGEDDRSGN